MIDLNNDDYRKILGDAANSKDGKIIVEFLQSEVDKLKFENIDEKLPFDQIGLEYKVINKTKKYFKKCLRYLI
jgi:hypothetical protein